MKYEQIQYKGIYKIKKGFFKGYYIKILNGKYHNSRIFEGYISKEISRLDLHVLFFAFLLYIEVAPKNLEEVQQ